MRFRRTLDQWYRKGLRDGAGELPPDPFMISSYPGVTHRDYRHIRRAYDAGWHDGQGINDVELGFVLQGELPRRRTS